MKPVLIEEEAERELAASVVYYEQRRAGLGVEFHSAAHEAVSTIQTSPEHCALRKDGTRRFVMRRFPFVIHYMEMPEHLWVVAFAHTSRKPNYWQTRLKRKSA